MPPGYERYVVIFGSFRIWICLVAAKRQGKVFGFLLAELLAVGVCFAVNKVRLILPHILKLLL